MIFIPGVTGPGKGCPRMGWERPAGGCRVSCQGISWHWGHGGRSLPPGAPVLFLENLICLVPHSPPPGRVTQDPVSKKWFFWSMRRKWRQQQRHCPNHWVLGSVAGEHVVRGGHLRDVRLLFSFPSVPATSMWGLLGGEAGLAWPKGWTEGVSSIPHWTGGRVKSRKKRERWHLIVNNHHQLLGAYCMGTYIINFDLQMGKPRL